MACALTQSLNLDCRDSFGGIKQFYIMEYDNATTITETAGVVTAITKATGKLFREYKLVAFTGDGSSDGTHSREMGTKTYKQTVSFPINKMTASVRIEIGLLAQNRLLIVGLDNNGTGWLFGKGFGMMLTTDKHATGKALGDRNGFELAFESDEKEPAVPIDATTLTSLTVAGT